MMESIKSGVSNVKGIIMPSNKFKKAWDFLIVFHLLYTAFIVPYRVCFLDNSSDFVFFYELWMDACFMVDIVLTFFTAV